MQQQIAVFLCTIACVLALNYQDGAGMNRIFGGTEVTENGKVPWVVAVMVLNENLDTVETTCGGVIVNNLTVITAAQCLAGLPRPGLAPHRVRIYLGAVVTSTVLDQAVYVTNYTIHPDFVIHSNSFDIAVITLAKPQLETDFVQYALMPTAAQYNTSFVGVIGTVYGWGVHDKADTTPKEPLSYVDMKILASDVCAAKMKEIYYNLQNSSLCTDTVKATKGICKFDAGGPLLVTFPGSPIRPTLVGVASYFDACMTKYPNVFTKVGDAAVLKWITANGGPK